MKAATKVAAAVVSPSKLSALFLTADLSLIEQWAQELQPAIVHLGAASGLLSPRDAAILKRKLPHMLLMRSIPVVNEASIAVAQSYAGIADFLLLDSHRESDRQIGALGVTHDWSISRRNVELVRTPVILAGGLGPDVILETPVMLAASWFVCRWCVGRVDVPRTVLVRSEMGAVAFVVLMAAEFGLAGQVFGRSLDEQLSGYASVPGAIDLAAQIVFAAFPIVQVWRR